jgi:hypothetical protein
MTISHSDAIQQTERALLGSILLDNSVWPPTELLTVDDFSLDSHRRIYSQMAAMFQDQRPVDLITLGTEFADLDKCGGPGYLSDLVDGCVPQNAAAYVRQIRKAGRELHYKRLFERLRNEIGEDGRVEILRQMEGVLKGNAGAQDWRTLFHSYDEIINAPPARFVIDGFLQEDGITLIGGLAGHGKTLCMLAMVRALLEGGKLFDHFNVNAKAERVIYLIPEAGLAPFSSRLKAFRLEEHVQAGHLFCRTLSAEGQLSLTDPRLLDAVKGADVFLDTAIRFMDGAEDAENSRIFADTLFGLQRAGARTICGAHHSPKSFGRDSFMTLENVLRGSGDIGAMLATCWGLSQVDATSNRIFVQNVKARDFSACEPFIIQGRPSIDQTGYFELTNPPGFAGDLSEHKDRKAGRPEMPAKQEKRADALRLHGEHKSIRDISRELQVGKTTVSRWLNAGREG